MTSHSCKWWAKPGYPLPNSKSLTAVSPTHVPSIICPRMPRIILEKYHLKMAYGINQGSHYFGWRLFENERYGNNHTSYKLTNYFLTFWNYIVNIALYYWSNEFFKLLRNSIWECKRKTCWNSVLLTVIKQFKIVLGLYTFSAWPDSWVI